MGLLHWIVEYEVSSGTMVIFSLERQSMMLDASTIQESMRAIDLQFTLESEGVWVPKSVKVGDHTSSSTGDSLTSKKFR